jgi:hypothetical protein
MNTHVVHEQSVKSKLNEREKCFVPEGGKLMELHTNNSESFQIVQGRFNEYRVFPPFNVHLKHPISIGGIRTLYPLTERNEIWRWVRSDEAFGTLVGIPLKFGSDVID